MNPSRASSLTALRPLDAESDHSCARSSCALDQCAQLPREGSRLRGEPACEQSVDGNRESLCARPVDRAVGRRRVKRRGRIARSVENTEIDARGGRLNRPEQSSDVG